MLSTHLISKGQLDSANKVFIRHDQTCNVVGTSEEDIVIALYRDSQIKVIIYTSSYFDHHSTISRRVCSGWYYISNDTLKVRFTSQSTEMKSKLKMERLGRPLNNNWVVPYPPTTYIMDEYKIATATGIIPTLVRGTATDMLLLDENFKNWDKSSNYIRNLFAP